MLSPRSHGRFLVILLIITALIYVSRRLHFSNVSTISMVKSQYDWSALKPYHPVSKINPLPTAKPQPLRPIQHRFESHPRPDVSVQGQRREAVRDAFKKCWASYKQYAWMRDELEPLTAGAKDTFGGWAATLVDSLDTLWIMGLDNEFREAAQAAVTINWDDTSETAVNIFETNIRYLGGLLSAYDLSGEPALLEKAKELGDLLYAGFDTPNRMPPFWLDFQKAKTGKLVADNHEASTTAGSMSLEFTRLSQLTGDNKYYDAIVRITDLLFASQNFTLLPGMWPAFFDMREGIVTNDNTFTLGALADSLYEYLPKMYALLGGLDDRYRTMYTNAAETAKNYLMFRPMVPDKAEILFTGTARVFEEDEVELSPEGQHLGCFTGGFYGLGGQLFDISDHVDIGKQLTRGCAWAYKAFPTGIMPEIFAMSICPTLESCEWNETRWEQDVTDDFGKHDKLPKGFKNARDPRYILRPEAIESVFLLYRMTGLEEFREVAWDMFTAIQQATETDHGNAAIADVTVIGRPRKQNSMESFWLAETLKYFYLIFSPPDFMSLDDWVLNTEAHPFRIPKSQ